MQPDLATLPWTRFEEVARHLVELDVDRGDEPRHRLTGYHGEEPLVVVDLRPFPPGGVQTPMVEAMAGLLALGADRFAAALPGRAWSMDDPIAPVSDDGDLRQRVLMMTTAQPGPGVRSWVLPFDLDGGRLTWHAPVLEEGPCEGWVPYALGVATEAGWEADPEGAIQQLGRCAALGHTIMLAPAGEALLEAGPDPTGQPEGR